MTKKASQATGLLMSLGQEIQCNDKFFNDHCIPVIVQCLGEVVGPRVLKNYFIELMLFLDVVHQTGLLYSNQLWILRIVQGVFKKHTVNDQLVLMLFD